MIITENMFGDILTTAWVLTGSLGMLPSVTEVGNWPLELAHGSAPTLPPRHRQSHRCHPFDRAFVPYSQHEAAAQAIEAAVARALAAATHPICMATPEFTHRRWALSGASNRQSRSPVPLTSGPTYTSSMSTSKPPPRTAEEKGARCGKRAAPHSVTMDKKWTTETITSLGGGHLYHHPIR